MSAPDIDRNVIDRFSALSGEAHLTIVLGAGASAPSGLPNWDEFAQRLALLSGLVPTDEAAQVLLRVQDPTIMLEGARSSAGEQWGTLLSQALYGETPPALNPSPLHLASAGHYIASPDTTTLATLNFDTLLETALLSSDVPLVVIDTEGGDGDDSDDYADSDDADSDDDDSDDDDSDDDHLPVVHHLHGAILEGTAYSTTVTYRDFAQLVAEHRPWQHQFLSDALQRGPLLLAGTSYRDPDIRHWLHLIMRDEKPPHSALVTIVREGLGLDRKTFELIDHALAAEWESIGLTALRMQDLTDVALVIRELQHAGKPGYLTPNERSRQVWDTHRKHFRERQDSYPTLLAGDAKIVAEALDVKVQRATLWIANARGKLARWATEGVRYSGVSHLKTVPSGHDSRWIAGEALASEEVKLKDVHREPGVNPTWRSVLAIPVFVGDGQSPDLASAVLTFGLSRDAATVGAKLDDLRSLTKELSDTWGTRLSTLAFHGDDN